MSCMLQSCGWFLALHPELHSAHGNNLCLSTPHMTTCHPNYVGDDEKDTSASDEKLHSVTKDSCIFGVTLMLAAG